ncbi:MAG TPA: FAD-binding oxidoreductase [Bauldia sp.]|nr:FAD-binding oxidoreductase [Bauldia sp.]
MPVTSWGRTRQVAADVREPAFADQVSRHLTPAASAIGYGLGRSYGDVCLNAGGRIIRTANLDRILAVDWERGILRAESGCTFDALLRVMVPRGWFLPVTPGTKFVTLGGAVANDVHGKNHESAGTLGCHVRAIGLQRSDGRVLELSPTQDPALFAATIGGLGLTGLILWVELALAPMRSAYFETETIRMRDLDDFFAIAGDSQAWPYTVAWVDCLLTGNSIGRGLFTRARPASTGNRDTHRASPTARVPIVAPSWLLGSISVAAFNRLYAARPWALGPRRQHYDAVLFPLDSIADWNRLYGRRGFYQHQSVVPLAMARAATRTLLELTARARQGSFLVVLKLFGKRASPGILSFPMEGATLAIDLPNRGASTIALLDAMTDVVIAAGGRIYPAKDATMSAEAFRAGYPRWRELDAARDPAFSSDFWRRVTGVAA